MIIFKMKAITVLSIGALLIGAAAQTAERTNDTCSETFTFDCPYICVYIMGTICSKRYWVGSNASGCSPCPGIPSTCPATWIENCAYICENTGFKSDPWCSPDDLTPSGNAKCTVCPGKPVITAAPAPSVISGIPQPLTTTVLGDVSLSCPTGFNPDCQFVCDDKTLAGTNQRASCFKEWSLDENVSNCAICPGVPTTCPTVSTPSCAFLCKASFQQDPFCNTVDLTGYTRSGGTLSCEACDGSTSNNSSVAVPTSVVTATSIAVPTVDSNGNHTNGPTSPLPSPTYSSQASLVGISTATLFGLLCIFAM
ncbi:hypothetical protein TWF481_003040 [Arthrobotrys musiformis]|uniref:Uncharacterized protein n=1 Tax=Arthrobotrys musiformis TaxID=47236 RepID=A0AAV9VP32_9PEZI